MFYHQQPRSHTVYYRHISPVLDNFKNAKVMCNFHNILKKLIILKTLFLFLFQTQIYIFQTAC